MRESVEAWIQRKHLRLRGLTSSGQRTGAARGPPPLMILAVKARIRAYSIRPSESGVLPSSRCHESQRPQAEWVPRLLGGFRNDPESVSPEYRFHWLAWFPPWVRTNGLAGREFTATSCKPGCAGRSPAAGLAHRAWRPIAGWTRGPRQSQRPGRREMLPRTGARWKGPPPHRSRP